MCQCDIIGLDKLTWNAAMQKINIVKHILTRSVILCFLCCLVLISADIVAAQPAAPILVSPANESVDISITPTFKWRKVTNATSYRIWISKSPTFPGNDTRYEPGISDTTFSISAANPLDNYSGVYYWRVAAFNQQGQSQFSTTWVYTTISADKAPVLLTSPSNNATKVPVYPTLSWRGIPGVDQYQVSIATNAQYTGAINQSTNATSLIPINQLQPHTQYHWRVRTRFGQTDGPWSESRIFTTYGPPNSAPVLVSPSNLASQINRLPKLIWRNLPDAEFFQIQLSTSSNFSNIVFQQIGITDTMSTVDIQLNPIAQYFWRVRGGNDIGLADSPTAGFGPWSIVRSFITENVRVQLISPTNSAIDITQPLIFSWKELDGATSYTFELSKSQQFAPFIERQLLTPEPDTVRYQLLAVLESRTDYYWRVRAGMPNGDSDFSEVRSFKTKSTGNEPPPAVVLASPKNDSLNVPLRARFKWFKEPTSTQGYRLQLATSSNFAVNTIERNVLVSDTTYILNSDLLPGITHFWRVRGISPGGEGDWSQAWSFKTNAFPVILISPPSNAVNVSARPTFFWQAFSDAISYQIQVDKDNTFDAPDFTIQNITSLEARFNFPFENDSTYFWRVRAVTSNSFSSWSEVRKFTVIGSVTDPPGSIELVDPASDEQNVVRKPTFVWRSQPLSQSYAFQLSTSSTFIANELVVTIPSTLDTTYTPSINLLENTTYYWRVKGTNSIGDGPWSAVRSFKTRSDLPTVISLVSPQNNASSVSTSPTFTWQTSANSQLYHIQISLSNMFTSVVYELNNLTGISHSINTGLNLGTLYFWRVRGINNFGTGPWSEVRSFTTLTLAPPAVQLFLPANDSTGTPRRPRFVWVAAQDAISYTLRISTADNFIGLDDYIYTGIETTILEMPENLAYNTPYFWRVRAVNSGGLGAWSPTWKFVVQRVPVSLNEDSDIPTEFVLKQNYPNPFNPTTRIEYGLPETANVSMTVYDVMGRPVAVLVNEVKQHGYHSVDFDASSLPSGIYIVRVLSGNTARSIKLTLLK
jgi:hypothetical protein